MFLKISQNSQENTYVGGPFFNKVADLRLQTGASDSDTGVFCCRCFPVNFAKFVRSIFLQNTSGQLLLDYERLDLSKFQYAVSC